MRKSAALAGSMIAMVVMGWGFGARARAADDQAELTERERTCAVAGASGTVDKVMECFSSSEDLVAYDVFTPREFDGPKAVRGYFQNYFGSVKNAKIDFIDLHVVTDGKIGYTHSIQHWTVVMGNGAAIDAIPRVTDVWRKENGRWVIILTHASYPVDPATFKADPHSKP